MLFLYQRLFGRKMIKYYWILKGSNRFIYLSIFIILFLYRISINDNKFKVHIDNISLNDRGRYQCEAENLVGRSQQIFNVQVHSKY